MAPSASRALGLCSPTPLLAGVWVAPDMPPEPPGLTLYFSDILKADVVKSLLVDEEIEEIRAIGAAKKESLILDADCRDSGMFSGT